MEKKTLAEKIVKARENIINAMYDGRIEHAKSFHHGITVTLGREINKLEKEGDPKASIYRKIQYELKMLLLDNYSKTVVPVDNEIEPPQKNVKEEIEEELGTEETETEETFDTSPYAEEYCDYEELLDAANISVSEEEEIEEEPIEEEETMIEQRYPEPDILDKLKDLLKEYEE